MRALAAVIFQLGMMSLIGESMHCTTHACELVTTHFRPNIISQRGAAAVPASNHRTVPGMQQRGPACECLKDPGEH